MGIVISVGAVALIINTAIEEAPPLQSLTTTILRVDGAAYLHKPSKAPAVAVLPAGGIELVIRNVCNEADCQIPAGLRQLQRNDRVTVWREGRTVWQAKVDSGTIYSYRQAVAEMNHAKAKSYLTCTALLAAGLLVILLAWRNAA